MFVLVFMFVFMLYLSLSFIFVDVLLFHFYLAGGIVNWSDIGTNACNGRREND